MPSVPYPELRSEPVRYLIVTTVDYSRVPVSLAWLLSLLAHVLALTLHGELHDNIVHALELVTGDMVAKVLPALHTLQFFEERPTVSVNRFVTVRQNTGRPVNIIYPDDNHNEEEDDSDE